MKGFKPLQKIVLSILISLFAARAYSQTKPGSTSTPQSIENDKIMLPGNQGSSQARLVAKKGQEIRGFKLLEIVNGPRINDIGQVLFTANTDKGIVSFIDDKPIAYVGMKIGGITIIAFGTPAISSNGRYGFFAAFYAEQNKDIIGTGLIVDGQMVLAPGQEVYSGYKLKLNEFSDDIQVYRDFYYSSVSFNSKNQYVIYLGAVIKHVMHDLCIINGSAVEDPLDEIMSKNSRKHSGELYYDLFPAISSDNGVQKDSGMFFYNANQQALVIRNNDFTGYISSAEHKYFPIDRAESFRMNNRGHIFTSDLQLLDYNDATITPSQDFERDHDKYIIDFPFEKLLGLKPLIVKNNKLVFDFFRVSGGNNDWKLSFNDNDQFVVLKLFRSINDAGIRDDGWALVAGRAQKNIVQKQDTDFPLAGDLVVYWNGSEYTHVGVVKHVIEGTHKIDVIRSKWGPGAVYDHDPNIVPYQNVVWTVWRRINKPAELVEFDDFNQLRMGTLDCSSNWLNGKDPNNNQPQDRKTDKGRHILLGNDQYNESRVFLDDPAEKSAPFSNAKRVDKYYPKYLWNDKEAITEVLRKYDCRGFVFGMRSTSIIDNTSDKTNNCEGPYSQVERIIRDGYDPINAEDIFGNSHKVSLKWLETHRIDEK